MASLSETIISISRAVVPDGVFVELLVVDNGSNSSAAGVINPVRSNGFEYKYVVERNRGLAKARNTGIAHSSGQVILWTDDDMRVPPNWVEMMTRPIVDGKADASSGSIRIAPQLRRGWQTRGHDQWMAIYKGPSSDDPPIVIGANMAFSREVLTRVQGFDEELGAGQLGYCEETLFSLQLRACGFRTTFVRDAEVEHHFDERRLLRGSWLDAARAYGRSNAYMLHHWEHNAVPYPYWQIVKTRAFLAFERLHGGTPGIEGISEREMYLRCYLHFCEAYVAIRDQPRKYDFHGLQKRSRSI